MSPDALRVGGVWGQGSHLLHIDDVMWFVITGKCR